jgi:hypothetical protein
MNPSIQIKEMRLQVPGLTREQGRQLGEVVAQRLSHLNVERSINLPALNLRVAPGATISVERMADEIVAGIRRHLE